MDNLIAWVEIPSTDFERAVNFYSGLLETKLETIVCETEKMACLPGNVGYVFAAPDYRPSDQGVIVSLNVGKQLDSRILFVEANGGKIVVPKTKIQCEGRGWFALFTDTEGNRLGLYGEE
ncbi:MAG: Glyoxalase/bleomycin resistance protein/dioxygenase [Bacteroidetes bacterium]|nr:Glyoxalase/bleomycin resistance protein/dioxygenase [Bacteroidota bacterium]